MLEAIYEGIKEWLLWLARVPPEPTDPMGNVASLRVFRASPAYLRYRTLGWAVKQLLGLAGVAVALIALLVESRHGGLAMLVVIVMELLGIALFLVHLVVSFFLLRLDYEMRWYKVSDRSMRVREGVVAVHELTLTFANVQNVTITQGPLQRLFGIADARVETAGGGGGSAETTAGRGQGGLRPNLHEGVFRGVDAEQAEAIRDLIVERIKRLQDGGLGDPDDPTSSLATALAPATPAAQAERPAPISEAAQGRLALLLALRQEAGALARAARQLAAATDKETPA
jgi:membrane protein YdbS with pleckstrin-like domain